MHILIHSSRTFALKCTSADCSSRAADAVYAGAAGLIVSVNRIITKAMMNDVRASTMLFFGVSIAFVVVCCLAFHATRCTEFVRFYVSMCRSSAFNDDQRAIMRPSTESAIGEEVSLVSVLSRTRNSK